MVSPEFSLAALSRCPDISQRVPGPTRVVSSLPASQLLANSSPLTPDNNSLGKKKERKWIFPFPFSGILARYQNAPLPLRVESVAQLFPGLVCQTWSDCRAYFGQLKRQQEREEKAGLSVTERCSHSHGGVYRRGVSVSCSQLPLALQIGHLLAQCFAPALQFANNEAFVPGKQTPKIYALLTKDSNRYIDTL